MTTMFVYANTCLHIQAGPVQRVSKCIIAVHVYVQGRLIKTMVKMAEAVKLPKAVSSIVRYNTLQHTHRMQENHSVVSDCIFPGSRMCPVCVCALEKHSLVHEIIHRFCSRVCAVSLQCVDQAKELNRRDVVGRGSMRIDNVCAA